MSNKVLSASFIVALAAGTVSVVAPTASAAPDGSSVVINEVYGGGGNSGAKYTHDFVELYNPTDQDIDLAGWTITQRSAKDTGNGSARLSGVIPAKGYFLVQGAQGNGGTESLPAPDSRGDGLTFSGSQAIARLINDNGNVVDLLGWGAAVVSEGSPARTTENYQSVQRKEVGKDTDNNADDFLVAEPTPQNSGNAGETPVDPAPENPTPQPGEVTPIADIQGTGAASPLVGKTVTTEGVVTAVYEEGGKNGFFLQAGGSGSEKHPDDASDGIFVYMNTNTDYPQRGESVRVSGQVGEHFTQTQITMASMDTLDNALEAPKAVEIETLPAGDEAREPYEGMLVRPKGPYTVTNNYTLNTYGELGLAPGERAHRTPTDVVAPGAPAAELQAKQDAEVVYLDDGRTKDYFRTDKNTPLPYIVTSEGGVKSIRTGDQVDFQTDVVVDYSFDQWRFQPLEPITGKNAAEELPIAWEDSRGAAYDVPDTVEGEYSIGFFNVLNYFSSLGKDEQGCKAYNDINGQPVSANNCKVRGAFSQDAFQDQQAKIATAINKLDTAVLGLSEIENTATVTGDVAKRDEALQNLVDALNAKEPNKWALVKSPQKLGTDEDFIRVAFIYQPAKVTPVGESIIFDDEAFTRTARQPLAQEFDTVGNDKDTNFVAVVNHFKSKGSVVQGDGDKGDGQGNNANVRTRQSEALLKHLTEQNQWAELPTFLVGDFNAYTKEDAITKLVEGGYDIVESEKNYDQASYQFAGQLGTLDHVLANAAANELIQDSAVWNINGDEPVAFEYSRRNYNAQDFFGEGDDKLYGYGNPFRSSDHDPVKVGFSTATKAEADKTDAERHDPQAGDAITVKQGEALPEAKTAVKDADQLPEDTTFAWSSEATDAEGTTTRTVTVTYPDNTTDEVSVDVTIQAKADESKPRYIVKTEINDNGELVVTYTDGQTENLGQVQGAKQHPMRAVLGILLGVLAGIAASLGALHFLMPGAVNEQLKQWGLR
ncbi:ExeM/NucH family extracellular endonuclease [Corynebacterium mucifaciens]|uniref:ExeM/NucH family extracellular endonuclease n=1 Tax=Corynebacterium mucifaciens TaxID=57171 RepID=A0A7X6LRY3_9CORY|nr:ExeM/NucH family extracellular endonuclease [Corynebacterium mucifaciens]NKY69218.1 ExeM/NucH family extracellular endonuclease [Corynebacterium mucifaciens]